MWYWDGRRWKSTTSTDGRWRWDGYDWIPLRNRYAAMPRAKPRPSAWLLLGLLILDMAWFVPGVGWASAAAAALVLLVIDGRGLVTLNGLINWRAMGFGQKLVVAFLEIVLFQFVVAAYIVLRLAGLAKAAWAPRRARRQSPIAVYDAAADSRAEAGPRDTDAMKAALEALLAQSRSQLPLELMEKLRTLVAAISGILPAYSASGLTAHDRFVVERTVDDYLPSALTNYLKLPAAYRSSPLRDADGKTANELLSEQLEMLRLRMVEVADAAYGKDVNALVVHGRFLRSKFGPSRLTVKG